MSGERKWEQKKWNLTRTIRTSSMNRLINKSFASSILVLMSSLLTFSQAETEVSGLIIPRDNDGMYVHNKEGQVEVSWTSKTKVALVVNTRLLSVPCNF